MRVWSLPSGLRLRTGPDWESGRFLAIKPSWLAQLGLQEQLGLREQLELQEQLGLQARLGLRARLGPVSYTHLDVYKRQSHSGMALLYEQIYL